MPIEGDHVEQDRFKHAELVFAIVSPVGTDYSQVAQHLKSQLSEFGYVTHVVALSGKIAPLCRRLGIEVPLLSKPEFERISTHMKAANSMYRVFNEKAHEDERNALLALAAVQEIRRRRMTHEGSQESRALINQAHILATIKRPEEIKYLRRIYGIGLHVIGVFATEEERVQFLIRRKGLNESEAKSLVEDDQNDNEDGGQRTSEAYHLADVFIDGGGVSDEWKSGIGRYLDLLFSHPYESPTASEQAMFLAYAASLRSAQFGRQVGAAISSPDGDILAIGCNEVPKSGGGQYWVDDEEDCRDHILGMDSNDYEKNRILEEIMAVLPESQQNDAEIRRRIKKTSLFSITEFGRATHAEMAALLSCARKGISPSGMTLFTTTFPCHNCARHIITAGIKRVVYIEPYPKSKATMLHEDAINSVETARQSTERQKVSFVPFVGISPRKYAEIFTVKPMYGKDVDRKLKSSGRAISWQRSLTGLRLQMIPLSYIDREALAFSRLADTFANFRSVHVESTRPDERGAEHVSGGGRSAG